MVTRKVFCGGDDPASKIPDYVINKHTLSLSYDLLLLIFVAVVLVVAFFIFIFRGGLCCAIILGNLISNLPAEGRFVWETLDPRSPSSL
jgi:hypothetical protein